jgi:hypothetical protein
LAHESLGEGPLPAVDKIVSGGQTGVDRAGLDVAIEIGIDHGGWCPRGRRAEDGPIPTIYQLTETESPDYPVRTEKNVIDSDGTLILYLAPLKGGTELTYRLAQKHDRPHRLIDLHAPESVETVRCWLHDHRIRVLNIAGPRERQNQGIYALARAYLEQVLGSA